MGLQKTEKPVGESSIAILWDIENVTPQSSNTLFIDGMWDYVESMGRIVISYAYADWSKPSFRGLAPTLANLHFYMIHVPRTRRTKNSADMQLVSDAFTLLHYYSHIDTYVLVTGDSDFRPLLLALRKEGKRVHIICDLKTAAQDLLILSDSFVDYREVIPDQDEEDIQEEGEPKENHSLSFWFERLAEASGILKEEEKNSNMGSVKIRMKMLNREFDERTLGFKRWGDFISAAVKAGYVRIEEGEKQTKILPGKGYKSEVTSLQKALKEFIEVLKELDGTGAPQFHSYSILSVKLKDRGVNTTLLGFSKFKQFISSAEARGLVETKLEGLKNYARRNSGFSQNRNHTD